MRGMREPAEISWDYAEIAVVLMQRFAPIGCVLTRADLGGLPQDLVLREEREPEYLEFSWLPVDEAMRLNAFLKQARRPASVSELQGRWQKFCAVMLWKFARDGVRLTELDRARVPADKVLLAHGHEQDIEYRFVPRAEAARIATWEADNEGKMVLETLQ